MKTNRRLIDKDGNSYVFEVPSDVNPESLDEILIGAQEGIVRLLAYKLVAENIYRDVNNQIIEDNAMVRKYNFSKKVNVFEDESIKLNQEEFGELMGTVIKQARETFSRINKVKVTHWENHPILQDARGYYIARELACAAPGCDHIIKGEQRLSRNEEGMVTRAQQYKPYDKLAQRIRTGSKLWMCGGCSAKSIEIPVNKDAEVKENIAEAKEVDLQPVISEQTTNDMGKKESGLNGRFGGQELLIAELMSMTSPTSETPAEYVKGFAHAIATILTGGMKESVR